MNEDLIALLAPVPEDLVPEIENLSPECAEFLHDEMDALKNQIEQLTNEADLYENGLYIPADKDLANFYNRLVAARINNPKYPEETEAEVFFYLINHLRENS